MNYKNVMKLVDEYVDLLDDPEDNGYLKIRAAYKKLENKVKELCDNQDYFSEEQSRQPEWNPVEDSNCACKGWGCRACCDSEQEIRGRQGIFG